MNLLHPVLAIMVGIAAMPAIASPLMPQDLPGISSGVEQVICIRKCTAILPSGYCSHYGACEEVLMSAPSPFKAVRGKRGCARNQALSCTDDGCTAGCLVKKKAKHGG